MQYSKQSHFHVILNISMLMFLLSFVCCYIYKKNSAHAYVTSAYMRFFFYFFFLLHCKILLVQIFGGLNLMAIYLQYHINGNNDIAYTTKVINHLCNSNSKHV